MATKFFLSTWYVGKEWQQRDLSAGTFFATRADAMAALVPYAQKALAYYQGKGAYTNVTLLTGEDRITLVADGVERRVFCAAMSIDTPSAAVELDSWLDEAEQHLGDDDEAILLL